MTQPANKEQADLALELADAYELIWEMLPCACEMINTGKMTALDQYGFWELVSKFEKGHPVALVEFLNDSSVVMDTSGIGTIDRRVQELRIIAETYYPSHTESAS